MVLGKWGSPHADYYYSEGVRPGVDGLAIKLTMDSTTAGLKG